MSGFFIIKYSILVISFISQGYAEVVFTVQVCDATKATCLYKCPLNKTNYWRYIISIIFLKK